MPTVSNPSGPRPVSSKLSWQKKLRGAGLTPAQYMVLMTISTYTDRQGRNAYPGWARLVGDTGLDVRTVKRAAKALQDLGWLAVTFEGGNQYRKGAAKTFDIREPRSASGAPRGASSDTQGGIEMPPHQIPSPDHGNHSASLSRAHSDEFAPEIDPYEEIEEAVGGFMDFEESTVNGMLSGGAHTKAIINTIYKQRGYGANDG